MNHLLLASIAINLLAFAQMAVDKRRAAGGQRRISEMQLLVPVLFSGIVGVLAGMLAFHHKTAKRSFQVKLVLALALFLGLAWFLFIRPAHLGFDFESAFGLFPSRIILRSESAIPFRSRPIGRFGVI